MLSEIFILTIPNDYLYRFSDFMRAVMLPGSICKHWRDVALSTPKLWSSINLELQEETTEADVDLARTWLTRSGGMPLSLRVGALLQPPATHPVMGVLTQQAERWEHVTFAIPFSMMNETRAAKNRLPRLRTLSISYIYDSERVPWTTLIDTFEVAPQLTNLTISWKTSLHVEVPLTKLTRIHMSSNFSLDQCYHVLRRAPNLMECHLRIHDRILDPSHPIIHHSHLHTLKMVTVGNPGPLFDRLILPALHSFDYYEESAAWPQVQFVSLLSRSSCSLGKLSLCFQHAHMKDDDLIECLHHMPSLVHLKLDLRSGAGITHKALARLTLPHPMPLDEQADYLVPGLEFMYLFLCHDIGDDVFADMVESRRRPSNAMQCGDTKQAPMSLLKTLRLDLDQFKLRPLALARLRDCANGGLDVREITYDYSDYSGVEIEVAI
jgi:hypothetical protein